MIKQKLIQFTLMLLVFFMSTQIFANDCLSTMTVNQPSSINTDGNPVFQLVMNNDLGALDNNTQLTYSVYQIFCVDDQLYNTLINLGVSTDLAVNIAARSCSIGGTEIWLTIFEDQNIGLDGFNVFPNQINGQLQVANGLSTGTYVMQTQIADSHNCNYPILDRTTFHVQLPLTPICFGFGASAEDLGCDTEVEENRVFNIYFQNCGQNGIVRYFPRYDAMLGDTVVLVSVDSTHNPNIPVVVSVPAGEEYELQAVSLDNPAQNDMDAWFVPPCPEGTPYDCSDIIRLDSNSISTMYRDQVGLCAYRTLIDFDLFDGTDVDFDDCDNSVHVIISNPATNTVYLDTILNFSETDELDVNISYLEGINKVEIYDEYGVLMFTHEEELICDSNASFLDPESIEFEFTCVDGRQWFAILGQGQFNLGDKIDIEIDHINQGNLNGTEVYDERYDVITSATSFNITGEFPPGYTRGFYSAGIELNNGYWIEIDFEINDVEDGMCPGNLIVEEINMNGNYVAEEHLCEEDNKIEIDFTSDLPDGEYFERVKIRISQASIPTGGGLPNVWLSLVNEYETIHVEDGEIYELEYPIEYPQGTITRVSIWDLNNEEIAGEFIETPCDTIGCQAITPITDVDINLITCGGDDNNPIVSSTTTIGPSCPDDIVVVEIFHYPEGDYNLVAQRFIPVSEFVDGVYVSNDTIVTANSGEYRARAYTLNAEDEFEEGIYEFSGCVQIPWIQLDSITPCGDGQSALFTGFAPIDDQLDLFVNIAANGQAEPPIERLALQRHFSVWVLIPPSDEMRFLAGKLVEQSFIFGGGMSHIDMDGRPLAPCSGEGMKVNNQNVVNITIYPNPVVDELTIKMANGESLPENTIVQIVDSMGSTKMKRKYLAHAIGMRDFSQGIYFIQGYLPDGRTFVQKIVKQ